MPEIQIGGVTHYFADRGSGRPLVLLHGFPHDSSVWDDIAADLCGECRVITPDLRGFGRSRSADPFTIQSLADEVHTFLEAIGALPCVLGGLSMGGYVALAYASRYPEDLRGSALVDTRADGDSPEAKGNRQKLIDLARESGTVAVARQMLTKLVAPGLVNDPTIPEQHVVRRLRQMMEACPPPTMENALRAMRDRPDRTAELPSIAVPTLIVVGDSDTITPPAVADEMRKSVPNATMAVVSNAGHMTPMEQPRQVSQALRQLMDRTNG